MRFLRMMIITGKDTGIEEDLIKLMIKIPE